MMRPQVELAVESTAECRKLALRMKRRKTVSVTPAMGARMVAGAMRTLPIWTDCGMAADSAARPKTGVSQYLRMELFYFRSRGICSSHFHQPERFFDNVLRAVVRPPER